MNQTTLTQNRVFALANPAIAGGVYMIAAGAAFAIVNICVQAATMNLGMTSSSAAFWQYFVALLCGLPWIVRTGLGVLKTDQLSAHVVRVGCAAIGVQFWVAGLASVPIWQAIALIMTSPFFVTAGAGLLLGEKVGPSRWLATAVGFAGGMIILGPWSDGFTVATLYPVVAALFWAATSLMTKRLTQQRIDRDHNALPVAAAYSDQRGSGRVLGRLCHSGCRQPGADRAGRRSADGCPVVYRQGLCQRRCGVCAALRPCQTAAQCAGPAGSSSASCRAVTCGSDRC